MKNAFAFVVYLLASTATMFTQEQDKSASRGLGPFERPAGLNPIIRPDPGMTFDCPIRQESVRWMARHAFNPGAVVKDGKVYVLFRAEDESGTGIGTFTSRLGLATSDDGIRFTVRPTPVLFPDHDAEQAHEWPGGCEDPRLVEGPDGVYFLFYTQWNHHLARLAVAVSSDLVHWTKHGSAFGSSLGGRYRERYCKSGAVVCALDDGRLKAVRIDGKFWMYWGEGHVYLASSTNLLDWEVSESAPGEPAVMLAPRAGRFDGVLAEAGPNAILTPRGILVLYNGKNAAGTYSGGQASFDAHEPAKLLWRADQPFFQPQLPFEMTGQYQQGTTFLEGLVYFRNRWFLYYGCADTAVAVAVCDPAK